MQQPRESKHQSEFNKGVQLAVDQKHLRRDHVSPGSDTVQSSKPSASPEQFDIFTPLVFKSPSSLSSTKQWSSEHVD